MAGPFFLRAPFTSSTGHRNAERANAIASITGSALQTFSPTLIVPQTLAQTLVSIYSTFRPDTHTHEKVAHLIQASLALIQLIMAITLIYGSNEECEEQTDLCKSLKLMQLMYKGTLIVAWALSESSKDPYQPQNVRAINANPEHNEVAPAQEQPRHQHRFHRHNHRAHEVNADGDSMDSADNPDLVVNRV